MMRPYTAYQQSDISWLGIHPNYNDPTDREQAFLADIIRRLNELFGDVGDEPGRRNFTNGTITRVTQNPIVVEQVEKHEKSIALKGDLPQAVKQAVVQALLKEGISPERYSKTHR